MSYLGLKAALMAAAIAAARGRARMLALLYFCVWALSLAVLTPALGQGWYWGCGFFEVVVVFCAMVLEPRAWRAVAALSLLNLSADAASVSFNALGWTGFYPLYPWLIRASELGQCVALIVYGDAAAWLLRRLYDRLLEHRRTTWMRRVLKPLVD